MAPHEVQRKLTAIISADVEGYSRLMGADEEATLRTLNTYREIMADLISRHQGRVVDTAGDSVLAEFASPVEAVRCAVEIQRELQIRNAELVDDRQMRFRIGINLGDVIVEGNRIYGEGVNIAARVEGLAEGGGICISGTVYEQIENKLPLSYEFLGEHAVKNIEKPVRMYRAQIEPATVTSMVGALELDLPDKPSIAVLPFANMSGDSEQEYFSDGITEDLITDLSKVSGLFVISRNSVFLYKGKAVKPEEVSRELGVRFMVEGSVRKAGDRVRITAQLVDATTGYHLWAERYDRDLKDIFDLQDEVTQKIVTSLKVKLTEGEQECVWCRYTDNVEAYDYFLRGEAYFWRTTQEANAQARDMFEKAVEMDPKYGAAHAFLGATYFAEWVWLWSQDPQTLERAFELAQKAIALDDSLSQAQGILGLTYLWRKQHEQAIIEAEKAIALDPNFADGYAWLGSILNFAGRPEEAIGLVEKAMRLNPHDPFFYLFSLGESYTLMGRYEEGIQTLKRALIRNPDFEPAHINLAVIFSELGREEEARAELSEALRISPDFSLEGLQRLPHKDQAVLDRLINALRKVGLK